MSSLLKTLFIKKKKISWHNPWQFNLQTKPLHISYYVSESESHLVLSDSLWPQGLYSPWNFPGHNTGVVAFPFSRGSSQPRVWTEGLPHCRRILYQLSHKGKPYYMLSIVLMHFTSIYSLLIPSHLISTINFILLMRKLETQITYFEKHQLVGEPGFKPRWSSFLSGCSLLFFHAVVLVHFLHSL